jgi:hypothetical protein
MIAKIYALPIVLRTARVRNRLYRAFASEEGKAHSEDMLANLPDEITYYRLQGDPNEVIAARILLRLLTGLRGDLASWAPGIFPLLANKITEWSTVLRYCKIPSPMIAGVATLTLMNYSLFGSQGNPTTGTCVLVNGMVIAMVVLIWKRKHPVARRIFNIWMGITITAGITIMIWLTINHGLYEILTFKVFMLAMAATLPTIVVVDKSWRKRLFKNRWWLIIICWAPIVAGACVGSYLITGAVRPLLQIWAVMVLLTAGLFIVCGTAAFGAHILCWLGIRGGASALQLVASNIRRLH